MFKTKRSKIVFVIIMCVVFAFGMAACGGGSKGGDTNGGEAAAGDTGGGAAAENDDQAAFGIAGANVAFILPGDDRLAINDRGWIEMTWTGVKNYCDANGKTCTWYIPLDNSTQGYYDAITTAINSGTEVILSLGSQGVEGLVEAANDFPDTTFISVEGNGHENSLTPNAFALLHQSDEAGFLAGVAAVKAGFTDIGLVTGLDIPPMNIWTYGYLQGINYQAGVQGADVKVRHHYVNSAAASPEIQATCASWYEDGCDLIIPMIAGGNPSLFAAADAADKWCFGADVDQGDLSPKVLTGAIKKLAETVPLILAKAYDGTFPGGQYKWTGVDDDAVGLATGHWRMDQFGYTIADYEADFEAFKNDVDGQRSGIIRQDQVRTDPTSDALDVLWDALPSQNVTFLNLK